jgi:hypothetical protein
MARPRAPNRVGTCVPAVLVGIGATMLASGCSFLFVDGPYKDSGGGRRNPNCTTSYALPVVDTVLTLAQIAGVAVLAGQPGESSLRDVQITASLSWMIVYGTSAITGFKRVSDCNDDTGTDMRPRPARLNRDQRKAEEAQEERAVQSRLRQRQAETPKPAGVPPALGGEPARATPATPDGGVTGSVRDPLHPEK